MKEAISNFKVDSLGCRFFLKVEAGTPVTLFLSFAHISAMEHAQIPRPVFGFTPSEHSSMKGLRDAGLVKRIYNHSADEFFWTITQRGAMVLDLIKQA